MKITLISPRMSLRPMDSQFKRRMAPSLSLLTVAALTPPGHEVSLEDENAGAPAGGGRPDLVGISVNVDTAHRAYRIARQWRDRGVPVVMGGIHASANHQEAAQHADAVCVGEAERTWPAIVADAAAGRLKRIYRSDLAADMATVPMPRWELAAGRRYLYTNVMTASRGCPFACEFCYNSAAYIHPGHRARPVEDVLAEIRAMGTRQVMFIDDNFIGSLPEARRLIDAMRPLRLTWHAAVSANIGRHEDLMDAMAQSGCRSLFIGFESINAQSVGAAGKHQNRVEAYGRLIRALHLRGIMINASLVFGFDEDGPDVFERTLRWLTASKIETMTAHILTPYPGTRLFERLAAQGRIIDYDWSHYNTSHVVFQPRQMTPQELRSGYLRMYEEFYSLAGILRRLPDNPRRCLPYLMFNLGYRKYGGILSNVAGRLGLMNVLGRLARRLSYGIG